MGEKVSHQPVPSGALILVHEIVAASQVTYIKQIRYLKYRCHKLDIKTTIIIVIPTETKEPFYLSSDSSN